MAVFTRRTFQRLKRKIVEPAVVTPPVAVTPISIPGTFDFSAALNSGLILLLEDI